MYNTFMELELGTTKLYGLLKDVERFKTLRLQELCMFTCTECGKCGHVLLVCCFTFVYICLIFTNNMLNTMTS
jgi:hypothetical protein